MRYLACHVDLSGVALATYELNCADDEEAKVEAKKLLGRHPTIELWDGPRRVARFVRQS